MRSWRLILDTERGAAENMAIDEAIMLFCADGSAPPTLRIYSWSRPAISLGCLQPILRQAQDAAGPVQYARSGFDLDFCRREGIELVRRITGGRAVVHGSDVTFSIALREDDLPEGCSSVIKSHQWLMSGIVSGLRRLGIDGEIGSRGGTASPSSADCFAHVAECDVRVGAAKAVGSAQVRRSGAILEQGSIPYSAPGFDTDRVFGAAGRSTAGMAAPLAEFGYSDIARAVVEGFSGLLQGRLIDGELSPVEIRTAAELAENKYARDEWTLRKSQPAIAVPEPAEV